MELNSLRKPIRQTPVELDEVSIFHTKALKNVLWLPLQKAVENVCCF